MEIRTKKRLNIIGSLIQNLREEKGITQSHFAKKLGTTQSAIARIESGEQNLSSGMLSKIGDILKKDILRVSDGSINISIEGGRKLSGTVITKSSKNSAMGLLCASLLNRGKTRLEQVPRIEEVNRMIEVLTSIGVFIRWEGTDLVIQPPEHIDVAKIDRVAAEKIRSSIMLIGPLSKLLKSFSLPHSGGCKLGQRTVRPHFYALENLGVNIDTVHNDYRITVGKIRSREIVLYESGDTVTENALMVAALTPGKTIIKYASANYQVQELCFFLEKLGVRIEGIGTSKLLIDGKSEIHEDVTYSISEDPIESMFMIAAAIVTGSRINIERAPIDFLEVELLKLKKMGFRCRLSKRYKANNGRTDLVNIETFPSRLIALEEKIHPNVYPGLNMDNLSFFAVIATQARGQTFIHDWPYEDRAIYYKELGKLGADIILTDPHRVYINGPTALKASEVICPPALRPAAIVLIGMLAAKGVSILRNIYSINRGYEDIIRRLNLLGARIKIIRGL